MDADAVNRRSVWIVTVLVALTRWPALSRTLWDWDEALFALAVRHYDVSLYHPQPPGFPLFIALAKLVPFHDEFHALQAVVFLASLVVFPAAYFLARELGAPFFVAMASALLLALMPNVWFYGGTAFSDVPSMVLSIVACTLLLRGRPSALRPLPSALWILAGAMVLGIAAGFRPQNLIIGFVPFVLASRARPRAAIAGALVTAVIVVASYGGAAAASGGWKPYRQVLTEHEHYIRVTDSFLSPIRPSLFRVADDFFLRPFRAPAINIVIALLALVALIRRRPHTLLAVAIFGPFLIFAWLYLDFHSTSRFSIGYMPMFALLAAEGIDAARKAKALVLAAVATLMIVWTWPALRIVHTTVSPPVAAIESLRWRTVSPTIYVDGRLGAHAALLLGREFRDALAVPRRNKQEPAVLLREGASEINFTRDRTRLAGIARDRYFEVSINKLR